MRKLFISMPMRGLTNEEIKKKMLENKKLVEEILGENLYLIDSVFDANLGRSINIPVWYLGDSLKKLAQADIVFFADGWKDARGCKIEHEVAVQYSIPMIEPANGSYASIVYI